MRDRDAELKDWTGLDLVDASGEKIGTVVEVRYGDLAGQPAWLVVTSGVLGTERILVPAGSAEPVGDRLRVPFDKETVENAPELEHMGPLVLDEEVRLCTYYGLDLASLGDGPIEGCPEGTGDFPSER